MNILVTGGSGFLGSALIPKLLEKGNKVYGLSRHPPEPGENLIPLAGDITEPNLGLKDVPNDIDCMYHLAGIHSLRMVDKGNQIYASNVVGTKNVLAFCAKYGIRKLIFTSTAYTWDINPYGRSKIQNEQDIAEYTGELSAVILKPSVVMGEEDTPYRGHFGQFVLMLSKLHRNPERVRRAVERILRLPLLRPVFRIPGNPHAGLNLVRIGDVIQALLDIKTPGTYWIVSDSSPRLQELGEWVGEIIGVDIRFEPDRFTPSLVEAFFQRKGASFLSYLWGDEFTPKADIKAKPIDRTFIQSTVRTLLKG